MTRPLWTVWHPCGGADGPQDGQTFRAYDAAEAATEWGKRFERQGCDYTLEETPEIVKVCPNDDPEDIQTFSVRAQTSRSYYATELTTP